MAVSKALRASLKWGDEEREELAEDFLDHKVFVYVETLVELLTVHGVEATDADVDLSDEILLALKGEAEDHAASVVDTYNADLDGFLDRNADLERESLLSTYDAWSSDRAEARAEVVAITEAYTASADATAAFYAANAQEDPEFDFGGHPELGDDDPACPTCAWLVEESPHPLARMLEVGSPHIGCRQEWHALEPALPDELAVPTRPAGIVGKDALVTRAGSQEDAVAELDRLRG